MTAEGRIAERREIEMHIRAEIERRTAVTPAMLHSIDEKGRLISVSDAWLAKLGYTREEVIGRPSSDFLTAESRERAIREVLPDFFRTGRCENVEYQMVRKDGEIIDVLLSAVLDKDASGGRASLAVITDISALKKTKRQLAESEARYRGLIEDQTELVSLATPEGELRYVNHAYASLYGKRPEEMIGRSLFDFVPIESHAALADHLRRVRGASHSLEDENQVILPTGERRWYSWTNRALVVSDGRVTALHSVGRDIEERVRAEKLLQESEARYRLLAENSTDLIMLVGRDGARSYASPACRTLLGYEPEEMLAMRTHEAIHPDDLERILKALASGDTERAHTYRMRRKDGGFVWVETTGKAVDVAGKAYQRLVVARNIDKRVAAEQRLKESEARYRLLADNSSDMVFQLGENLARRYVSPACREILGYEPEEMIGVNPVTMAHPEDAPRLALVFQSLMSGGAERQSIINRIRHRDGRWIWVEAQLRTLKDPETGRAIGIIGALRDISIRKAVEDELEKANRRLQALAGEDELTGLPNRRAFNQALAREFRRAKREKKGISLVMIDVDLFKAFNDHYGHQAGDDCLRRIGRAIAETIHRPGDVAARYGGEEFAVLLPDTDEPGAAAIAEAIRQAVLALELRHEANVNWRATISAGVASFSFAALTVGPEALLREADRALYGAKDAGRNKVARASAGSQAESGSASPKVA